MTSARCNAAWIALAGASALLACAGDPAKLPATAKRASGFSAQGSAPEADRCNVVPGRQATEYDTSGDGRPDVRKVYLAIVAGVDTRAVMICRQVDVDADGRKDIVRHYDDQGRALREEADRDFDGTFDRALVFLEGQLLLEELDENRDGKVDTKVYFENGEPSRAERDLGGRSSADKWQPDRWEYYQAGHMVRMGSDLDGDGKVDRWERDVAYKRPPLVGSTPASKPAAKPGSGS